MSPPSASLAFAEEVGGERASSDLLPYTPCPRVPGLKGGLRSPGPVSEEGTTLLTSASTKLREQQCPRLEAGCRLPIKKGAGGLSKEMVLGCPEKDFLIFLRVVPAQLTDIFLLLSTLSPSRVRAVNKGISRVAF